mmetsp:Transcript_12673/g.41766  ORF Transcript_12673/g.41766 Transcript_12673/m.41766 type:complete len:222 (-) Transcript_12673:895-1560(-)
MGHVRYPNGVEVWRQGDGHHNLARAAQGGSHARRGCRARSSHRHHLLRLPQGERDLRQGGEHRNARGGRPRVSRGVLSVRLALPQTGRARGDSGHHHPEQPIRALLPDERLYQGLHLSRRASAKPRSDGRRRQPARAHRRDVRRHRAALRAHAQALAPAHARAIEGDSRARIPARLHPQVRDVLCVLRGWICNGCDPDAPDELAQGPSLCELSASGGCQWH